MILPDNSSLISVLAQQNSTDKLQRVRKQQSQSDVSVLHPEESSFLNILDRLYYGALPCVNTFLQFFHAGMISVDIAFFCSSGGGVSFPLFTSFFRQ